MKNKIINLPSCNDDFDTIHLTERKYLPKIKKYGLLSMKEGNQNSIEDDSGIYTISFKGYNKETRDILSYLLLEDFGYSGEFKSIPSLFNILKERFVGIGIKNTDKMDKNNIKKEGRERYIFKKNILPKDLCIIDDITSLFSQADIKMFKDDLKNN